MMAICLIITYMREFFHICDITLREIHPHPAVLHLGEIMHDLCVKYRTLA